MTTAASPSHNASTDADERFLRRWAAWHRRGPLLYFLWVTVGWMFIAVSVAFVANNLIDHGFAFPRWQSVRHSANIPLLVGVLLGSVTNQLTRFNNNEERYDRLSKARNA